jgi:hypothetical protein
MYASDLADHVDPAQRVELEAIEEHRAPVDQRDVRQMEIP